MARKLHRFNKAFTIVELVIVIGVIGILSAILIPTFINITAKANVASDKQLISNLNNALAIQEQDKDDTHNYVFSDVLIDLEPYGYNVNNIVSKSGDTILWNQNDNRFILASNKTDINSAYWVIKDSVDANYSTYLISGSGDIAIINQGIDVSGILNSINIALTINSNDISNIHIASNGGDLTINSNINKDIYHFRNGNVLELNIPSSASYYEYGHFNVNNASSGKIINKNNDEYTLNISGPVDITNNNDVTVISDGLVSDSGVKITTTSGSTVSKSNGINDDKVVGTTNIVNMNTVRVNNASELASALNAHDKDYISIDNNISDMTTTLNIVNSVIIDGNGHQIIGTGWLRGKYNQAELFTINEGDGNNSDVDVVIKNIKLINQNTTQDSRCINVRKHLNSLELDNVQMIIDTTSGYRYPLFVGNSNDVRVVINNSLFDTGSGSAHNITTASRMNMDINNSSFNGYDAIHIYAGSEGAIFNFNNCSFNSTYTGDSNEFAYFAIEDSNVTINLDNSYISRSEGSVSTQKLFSYLTNENTHVDVTGCSVTIDESSYINWSNGTFVAMSDADNELIIKECSITGVALGDISGYIASGYHSNVVGNTIYVIKD